MSEHIIPLNFDLAETLDCGQAFRWEENDSVWTGAAFGKILKLKADGDKLYLYCTEDEFNEIWSDYFDLKTDYQKIREELRLMHPVLCEAEKFAPGIRVLRQEPWEALCSFIISQNNNIKRIKKIVKSLCETFGEDLGGIYSFPSAETLAKLSEEDLAPIKSGFRAKYILSAAQMVSSGEIDLKSLYKLELNSARNELMKIKGVGPKVADCVLLYGFHRTECFPLDVWMNKAMKMLFPNNKPEDFGTNAGIAQQFIFHYSRMHPELFK